MPSFESRRKLVATFEECPALRYVLLKYWYYSQPSGTLTNGFDQWKLTVDGETGARIVSLLEN